MAWENTWIRTARLATATRAAFEAMDLKLISDRPSDSVSGAFYPEGVDDSSFRTAMRDRYGVHIAGGQNGRGDQWKNKIFRVSHMGYVDAGDILAALSAIEMELRRAGHAASAGSALSAIGRVLDE